MSPPAFAVSPWCPRKVRGMRWSLTRVAPRLATGPPLGHGNPSQTGQEFIRPSVARRSSTPRFGSGPRRLPSRVYMDDRPFCQRSDDGDGSPPRRWLRPARCRGGITPALHITLFVDEYAAKFALVHHGQGQYYKPFGFGQPPAPKFFAASPRSDVRRRAPTLSVRRLSAVSGVDVKKLDPPVLPHAPIEFAPVEIQSTRRRPEMPLRGRHWWHRHKDGYHGT
jgi:hypothetical protein